ncbi:hypothetical protein [Luteirhabdus pelagi]|uniref:hypothetical protein n=1 Tax=Luteirhabdus pelagi TaxID=2792783 RepID=UPI001939ED50|nr:hypothetical protein [Luteirhabdus pelagi]
MNNTEHNPSEEVDLGYLFRKVGDFFKSIVVAIFLVIAFFKKYWILSVAILIIGFGVGYYLDVSKRNVYNNTIIVIPNFESVDYLYESIDELNSKIILNDSVFLKDIMGQNFRDLLAIEAEPIPDIYNFLSKSEEYIEAFRILYQNQELEEFLEGIPTSKNYKYHKLNFTIIGQKSDIITNKIFDYLNKNDHFIRYKEAYQQNTELQIVENEKLLAQIDSIVNATTRESTGVDQLINVNDGRLDMLLSRKQEFLDQLLKLEKMKRDQDAVIKVVSANYNVIDTEAFRLSNKIKIPILLLFLFSMVFFARYVYKGMKSIAEKH